MIPIKERFQGCLTGLAVGDALGAPVEFQPRGSFTPVSGFRAGGEFQLQAGQWTDDTSMALCLAYSLAEVKGFDPLDQLERYRRWYREGYLSSTGKCFDIGTTTEASIQDFEQTHLPYRVAGEGARASNGSIMRLAPVPLAFFKDPAAAIEFSGFSSQTTHPARDAVDACRYLGALLCGALAGISKDLLLAPSFCPLDGYWDEYPLSPAIQAVVNGAYQSRPEADIHADFLAANCLEAALWAFYRTDDFASGCLLAVNLGDDADTTAAVYGQIAGAYYGLGQIPVEWRQQLFQAQMILDLADGLFSVSESPL